MREQDLPLETIEKLQRGIGQCRGYVDRVQTWAMDNLAPDDPLLTMIKSSEVALSMVMARLGGLSMYRRSGVNRTGLQFVTDGDSLRRSQLPGARSDNTAGDRANEVESIT